MILDLGSVWLSEWTESVWRGVVCAMPRHLIHLTVLLLSPLSALGQSPGAKGPARPGSTKLTAPAKPTGELNTEIAMELLTGPEGVGLQAQKWTDLLQRLNIGVTIRRGQGTEELETTEEVVGRSLRRVTVIGRMERNGTLVFADRQFKDGEADKLAVWVRELKAWGAPGSAEGKPLWGLTREQFGPLFTALQGELTEEPQGQPLGEALRLWKLEEVGPLEITAGAKAVLENKPVVVHLLKGMSRGTSLAIALAEVDLGFRPQRMANGTLRVDVVTRGGKGEVWPVGWPPDRAVNQLVPSYFKFTDIDIQELPFQDVVETAGDLMGVPVFVDRGGLKGLGVDVSAARVSHPAKKTTWSIALRTLSAQVQGSPEILMDEAGTPFLWIKAVRTARGAVEKRPREGAGR